MRPPRTLFLTESFWPVLGGGEQHIRAVAAGLVASGMAATVVTRRTDPAWPVEETLDGIRVLRVPPSGAGRWGKYGMVPAVARTLARLRAHHDVLVVRGTRVLGLPGVLAARGAGWGVVLQPEVNGEMSGEVYTWGTVLNRGWPREAVASAVAVRNRLLKDADAFVAMSTRIRDEFLAAGMPAEKVVLIPHGVDTRRFAPADPEERLAARRRLGLPIEACLAVYTGRLLRGKGLEDLVAAFARAAEKRYDLHLLLVGSGAGQSLSIEEPLRAQVQEGRLSGRVTFTGRVENVEDYLRASDIFAFPSVFEALGLSLVEAAACGLPAVGARTGGIPDVIEDGRSGFLFTPGDVSDLAEKLLSLAESAGREEMGRAARTIACSRFDDRDALDRYRGLLREVSSRRGGNPWVRAPRAGAAPPRSPAPPA